MLATLYAAKKYLVPHLAQQCVKFLEVSLTARNACLLLSQSRLFEEPELMTRCWEVIDAQVCQVIYFCLSDIVKAEDLHIYVCSFFFCKARYHYFVLICMNIFLLLFPSLFASLYPWIDTVVG